MDELGLILKIFGISSQKSLKSIPIHPSKSQLILIPKSLQSLQGTLFLKNLLQGRNDKNQFGLLID
jgi:hypothetical protein